MEIDWGPCTTTQRRYNDSLITLLHHGICKLIVLPTLSSTFMVSSHAPAFMFNSISLQSKSTSCEEHDYFEELGSRTSLIVIPLGLALVALYSADTYHALFTMVGIWPPFSWHSKRPPTSSIVAAISA